MAESSLYRRIYLGFGLALLCLICLAAESIYSMRAALARQSIHAETFVPAKALAAEFNSELLNTRISFIYFVTIQKPGSLDQGWSQYHNAEQRLKSMKALSGQYEELEGLRAPVAKLEADLETYHAALLATLSMVQGGTHSGPVYDAQIKAWAALGAVVVGDATQVEELCVAGGRASTQSIVQIMNNAVTYDLLILIASLFVCLIFVRRILASLSQWEHKSVSAPLGRQPGVAKV